MVWIVWPDTRTVTVLSPDGGEWHLEEKDSLRGGPLLGGFTCPVRDFFA